jgi:hypothetical protein
MGRRVLGAICVAVWALWAGQAAAALFTYDITGTGSGTIGGQTFSNAAYDLRLTGDTANLSGNAYNPLSLATITIGGLSTFTFTSATTLGHGVGGNQVVFFGFSGGSDIFDFNLSSADWTALQFGSCSSCFASTFGPLIGTNPFISQFANIGTSGGALTFTGSSNVAFSSFAVPEPATWMLLIVGIGLAGGLLRHRRALARAA